MRTKLLMIFAILMSLFANTTYAVPVTYQFTALSSNFGYGPNGGESLSGNFTYTAPGFITTDTSVLPANLDSCSISFSISGAQVCGTMKFYPNYTNAPGHDMVDFETDLYGGAFYYFNAGAFSAIGSYATTTYLYDLLGVVQEGTLIVSAAADNGQAPEPASIALLTIGLVGLAGIRRRRTA